MIRDTDTPTGAPQKLVFEYDYQGRRIRKTFFTYSGGWVEQSDLLFLYDLSAGQAGLSAKEAGGWNVLAELDANASNAKVRTYVWGTDLSGSLTGAGGIGGLLKVTYYGSTTTNAFLAYDGNGNVGALMDAANGSAAARYDYGPFGEPIRVSGTMGTVKPIRFSTKYMDSESGLLYYGYRYYSPLTGRWLSRDPIGERGGVNSYAFVGNSPVGEIDLVGWLAASVHSVEYRGHGSAQKNGTFWQYVEVDSAINGQVPLNVSDTKPAASVTATLDDGFDARIAAWTALSGDTGIRALQMSTDLNGTIKACCPCPFKKVRATWSASLPFAK
jgi:RHS repeat-associated protein